MRIIEGDDGRNEYNRCLIPTLQTDRDRWMKSKPQKENRSDPMCTVEENKAKRKPDLSQQDQEPREAKRPRRGPPDSAQSQGEVRPEEPLEHGPEGGPEGRDEKREVEAVGHEYLCACFTLCL